MINERKNPAALAGAYRVRNSISLAAINPDNKAHPLQIQEIRAAFIARKCRISRDIAETIALLAFGETAQ